MSSYSKKKQQKCTSDINSLLLAAEAAQKADILTYSSGHLGPRSLNQNQPPKHTKQFFWRTPLSQGETLDLVALKKTHAEILASVKKKDTREFPSEDTPGTPLVDSRLLKSRQDKATYCSSNAGREETKLTKTGCSSDSMSEQPKASSLKESVTLPDMDKNDEIPSSWEDLKNEGQMEMKPWFDWQVTGEQDICAGVNFAEAHQEKLQEELKKLSAQGWPSRDRLAVFSDVFDDVCEGSPVFGRILREIKRDYDLYVNHLMDAQSSQQNMLLRAPVEDSGEVRETELDEAEKDVSRLQQEAQKAAEEKKQAHDELQNISATRGPENSDKKTAVCAGADTSLTGLQESATVTGHTDIVQIRRLQILNMRKEIQQLEFEIHEQLAAADTTAAAERHLKDLKTEMIKLLASNHRLRTISKDLEKNINMLLNREKASKAIRRMLWDEIYSDLQPEGEQPHRLQSK
ncbi:uncharacterized protein C6orf118-like [Menidia menidia]